MTFITNFLKMSVNDTEVSTSPGKVTLDKFSNFLGTFGPLAIQLFWILYIICFQMFGFERS